MDYVMLILGFAVVTVTASNVAKELIKVYFPQAKVGLSLAVVFGLWASIGYGQGVIGMIFKLDYAKSLFPWVLQSFDIVSSGLLYTLGSKIITDVVEVITGKLLK